MLPENGFLCALQIVSVPAFLLNLFCLYVIVKKSTPKLREFARHLAAYQMQARNGFGFVLHVNLLSPIILKNGDVTFLGKPTRKNSEAITGLHLHQAYATIFDLLLGLMFTPEMLFPVPGGYTEGLAKYTGLSPKVQLVISSVLITQVEASVAFLFVVRQQAILMSGDFLKLGPLQFNMLRVFFHLILSSYMGTIFAYHVAITNVDEVIPYYMEKNPDFAAPLVNNPNGFVFAEEDAIFLLINIAIYFFILVTVVIVAVVSSLQTIWARRKVASRKTQDMQWRWIKVLIIQFTLPLATVCVPLLVGFMMIFIQNFDGVLKAQPRVVHVRVSSTSNTLQL